MKVSPQNPKTGSMIGLAVQTLGNGVLHGLRHAPKNNSNGWYLWCGEYSEDEKFFSPICIEHLEQYLDKGVLEFLDLPPGFRFLIDGKNYEDVWFDEKLLND